VVIEAIRGRNYMADIAVDDIVLSNQACGQGGTSSVTPAPGQNGTITCNFESQNLCGYSQDKADQFDWTWATGSSATQGTGPTGDHTQQSGAGHYMLMEASGHILFMKTRLISPISTSNTPICVNFYYYMYGQQIRQLNVYSKVNGQLGRPIWQKTGDQGTNWLVGQVTVNPAGQNFQVSFHSYIHSFTGHYLYIEASSPRRLNDKAVLTSQVFDGSSQPLCFQFWYSMVGTNIGSLNIYMLQGGVQTPMWHLVGNQRSQWSQGKFAVSSTQSFQLYDTNNFVLSNIDLFYTRYHMYGPNIGTMNLYVKNRPSLGNPIWSRSGTQGNSWTQGAVVLPTTGTYTVGSALGLPLFTMSGQQGNKWTMGAATIPTGTATQAYHVVFEGIVGNSYRGDIAIDDVSFSSGACGNPEGYYVYIETSGRRSGQKARLISPQVDISSTGSRCVTFWYHMYGQNVDRINMYAQYGLNLPSSPTWVKQGTQGNKWVQAQITVSATKPFNIVLEGVRGTSYKGDIGLDDVAITDGACAGSTTSTQCDFEQSSICGFTQVHGSQDQFDWTWDAQGTQSGGTGPQTDHTLGTARGNQGPTWKVDSVTVPASTKPFQVMFEGVVGGGYLGDLAIDDYSIQPGACGSTAISCNFDQNSLCTWTQVHDGNDQFDWQLHKGQTGSSQTGPTSDKSGNGGNSYGCDFTYDFCGWHQVHATAPWGGDQFDWTRFRGRTSSTGTGPSGDHTTGTLTSPAPSGAPNVNSPLSCDFESTSMCGYANEKNTDDFDWIRNAGSTSSAGTGPFADHSLGTKTGTYLFIEASRPRRNRDRAWLQSSVLPATGSTPQCLQFWYSMFGRNVGSLTVYISQNGSMPGYPMWALTGNKGVGWKSAQVALQSSIQYTVVFEGQVGSGILGDIALDDLSMTSGQCALTPANALPQGATTPAPTSTQPTTTIVATSSKPINAWFSMCVPQVVLEALRGVNYAGDIAVDDISLTNGLCSVWTKSRSQGNQWNKALVTLQASSISNNFQVAAHLRMAAVHGKTLRMITLTGGTELVQQQVATLDPQTITHSETLEFNGGSNQTIWSRDLNCNAVLLLIRIVGNFAAGNSSVACDFEDAQLCAYIQDKTEQFDWSRTSGSTGNQGTPNWIRAQVPLSQPNVVVVFEGIRGTSYKGDIAIDDVTVKAGSCGGTRGHYMFIESSSPRRPGDNAIFQSATLVGNGQPQCIQFYFNMYGQNIGTLRVWAQPLNGAAVKLWELTGNQGVQWSKGAVSFTQNAQYQILLEAVRGNGYRGDMAVDDISFSTQSCPLTPASANPSLSVVFEAVRGRGISSDIAIDDVKMQASCPPPGDCTFESGACGWANSKSDDDDWVLLRGNYTGSRTHPTGDHTFGLKQGTYLYIGDGSVYRPGAKADLLSPSMVPTSSSGVCFKFWSYTFEIYNKMLKAPQNLLHKKKIILVTNYQGSSSYNLVFEGVRGTSYRGDIGLDDITFTDGACTGSSVSGSLCTFEEATLCGIIQDKTDDFDWTRKSGPTSSSMTGPPNDHTLGTRQGSYMYIEASSPRTTGQKARFFSTPNPATNGACVSFFYHMYGRQMGTLNVYAKVGGALGAPILTTSGNHGNKWLQAQVTVSSASSWQVCTALYLPFFTSTLNVYLNTTTNSPQLLWSQSGNKGNNWLQGQFPLTRVSSLFTIYFEGIRGSSFTGDIAIDDISLINTPCGCELFYSILKN
ncbi:MLRP1-like protein, partial [Mya arenaria]